MESEQSPQAKQSTPRQSLPVVACIHLGPELDKKQCAVCKPTVFVPLYHCPLHGACSADRLLVTRDRRGRVQRWNRYLTCADYMPGWIRERGEPVSGGD